MGAEVALIRVALVEDDSQVRAGLRALIDSSQRCTCVADFPTAEAALERLPSVAVDVVLMDIHLPGLSGIDCIRELKRRQPNLQIMMLTVLEDHDRIFASLAAGASGYLLKQTPPERLLEAIAELHQGGSPMSTQIARRVIEAFRQPTETGASVAALSPREREIVALLGKAICTRRSPANSASASKRSAPTSTTPTRSCTCALGPKR